MDAAIGPIKDVISEQEQQGAWIRTTPSRDAIQAVVLGIYDVLFKTDHALVYKKIIKRGGYLYFQHASERTLKGLSTTDFDEALHHYKIFIWDPFAHME